MSSSIKLSILLFILVFFSISCASSKKIKFKASDTQFEEKLIPKIQDSTNPIYYNLEDRMKHYNIPGLSIVTIKNGDIHVSKGYGYSRIQDKVQGNSNTIYHAGSISKSITALIVMLLQDEGLVSLDTDVRQYLKSWKLPENTLTQQSPITLRTLLNHTAGIKTYNSKGFIEGEKIPSLSAYLDGKSKAPALSIDTIPGKVHSYSSRGYSIIQLIIEDITSEKFEDVAKRMIFDPLNMSNSTFEDVFPVNANVNYAYSYDKKGNLNQGCWNYKVQKSAGGLKTTASDLAKFCIAIRNSLKTHNGFLKMDLAKEMMYGENYGLGFDLKESNEIFSFSHSGRVTGFFAYMILFPSTGDGLVMLTNSDNGGNLFQELLMGFSELNSWDLINPKRIQSVELPQTIKEKYIGDYVLKLGSDIYEIQVRQNGSDLLYKMKSENESFSLKAISQTEFIDIIEGESFRFEVVNEKTIKLISNSEYEFVRIKD